MKNKLSALELHDQELEKLEYRQDEGTLMLQISRYNQEIKDYDQSKITFSLVSDLDCKEALADLYETEINSMEVTRKGNQAKVTFVLLKGFGKKTISLSFKCMDFF